MIANNKNDDTHAFLTGWEVIDYVKKLRNVLKKLLSLLQQGTLLRDTKNRSNNDNQYSCITVNDGRSANFQSINSPLQNDNIDNSDNCKNGHNCTNSNYENDDYENDNSYDDNSDSLLY